MNTSEFEYSEKYQDAKYEYRHVIAPKDVRKCPYPKIPNDPGLR